MAALNYRDPATGQWVAVPLHEGLKGPHGPKGSPGVAVVSADAGNSAVLGADGQLFVPAGGLDAVTAASLYVDVVGDAMTGELLVPDQVAVPPTDKRTAAARGYVDQVVTVSDVNPAGVPVRDGLAWFVVGEEELPPPPPTSFVAGGQYTPNHTLTWVDSTDVTATYEIRHRQSQEYDGDPITDADELLVSGLAAGVQTFYHATGGGANGYLSIYGIKAVSASGESEYVRIEAINVPE